MIDGDTFELQDGRRIRIAYVDAPEIKQPGGDYAQAALLGLILDRDVTLRDVQEAAYGRTQARVLWRKWDIGATLLQKGHAWIDERYLAPDVATFYREKMQQARAAQRGLWADLDPVPPWEWRQVSKEPIVVEQTFSAGPAARVAPSWNRPVLVPTIEWPVYSARYTLGVSGQP